jgi:murein DD-endopeptidase MepM/ murein hydrolase activator NlpD
MWLLDWLLDQWDHLWALLVLDYNAIRKLASRGLDWITDRIDYYYRLAFDWIIYYYNQAKYYVDAFKKWIVDIVNGWVAWLTQKIAEARAWADQAVQDARAFFQALFNTIYNWAAGAIQSARDWATSLYNQAIAWIVQAKSDVMSWALARLADLRAELQALNDAAVKLLSDLIGAAVVDFNNFRASWEGLLYTFFNNPALFVFSLIEAYLYPWLEWFLANLLGSVNTPLPPKPDLFGGGGGTIPPPGGIPPGSGNFIFPTSVHSISGYHFSPTHPGTDFGTPTGTPCLASDAGIVTEVLYQQTGYGYHVGVSHADGWFTRYAHLGTIIVGLSQRVDQGQELGTTDNTGNSTGPHLHFEIRKDGTPYDPMLLLH